MLKIKVCPTLFLVIMLCIYGGYTAYKYCNVEPEKHIVAEVSEMYSLLPNQTMISKNVPDAELYLKNPTFAMATCGSEELRKMEPIVVDSSILEHFFVDVIDDYIVISFDDKWLYYVDEYKQELRNLYYSK